MTYDDVRNAVYMKNRIKFEVTHAKRVRRIMAGNFGVVVHLKGASSIVGNLYECHTMHTSIDRTKLFGLENAHKWYQILLKITKYL